MTVISNQTTLNCRICVISMKLTTQLRQYSFSRKKLKWEIFKILGNSRWEFQRQWIPENSRLRQFEKTKKKTDREDFTGTDERITDETGKSEENSPMTATQIIV